MSEPVAPCPRCALPKHADGELVVTLVDGFGRSVVECPLCGRPHGSGYLPRVVAAAYRLGGYAAVRALGWELRHNRAHPLVRMERALHKMRQRERRKRDKRSARKRHAAAVEDLHEVIRRRASPRAESA